MKSGGHEMAPRTPPLRIDRAFSSIAFAATVFSLGLWPGVAWGQASDANAGKAVYERKCLLCHGEKGDGKGPAAELLDPKPRDFTSGIYKIRTTAGKAPSDQDLYRVISDGMPGTSMPSWAVLPEKDRWNVVAYVKAFAADKFKEATKKQELPKDVASSADSIKRGKEMFEAIECNKCHGAEGRADGPSRPELKDEWGHPIKPANLTKRWTFRGGGSRTEIATRLAIGVLGTPMPTFIDSVEKPEDIWHLTNYVLSLGPESPGYATLITVTAVSDAIPDDPDADFWKKMAPQNVGLMGQVIQDPRNFNPSIDMVAVRAAWNDKEIAFHLTWDDPTESKPDAATKVFADAITLQFPPKVESGGERPYFLMGNDSDGVYLLRWEQGKGARGGTAVIVPTPGGPTAMRTVLGAVTALVFALGVATFIGLPGATAQGGGGTIEADVKYNGAPQVEKLKVNKDTEKCGTEAVIEKVVVGGNKGLANAVVSVPGAKGAGKATKATIDQHGCKFVPHVIAMNPGHLELKHSDDILHNIHTASTPNPSLNQAQPKFKKVMNEKLEKHEFVKLTCDV